MGSFVFADQGSRDVVRRVRQVSKANLPVLITGETGTGKEELARELHAGGAGGPFVVADCSVLRGDTARTELFGAKRGAFTGAVVDMPGLVREAEGGTLFLDEVGEASPELQRLLLRFCQTGEYRRLGESVPRRAGVRMIAATNRDLWSDAKENLFRLDLLYRLAVCEIEIPPLRERPADIPVLVDHFVGILESAYGRGSVPGDSQVEAWIAAEWPGNVRELRHAVERFFLGVCDPPRQSIYKTSSRCRWASKPFAEARRLADREAVRAYLEAKLGQTQGNVTRASECAGIGRQYFQKWMSRLGIDPTPYRLRGSFEP